MSVEFIILISVAVVVLVLAFYGLFVSGERDDKSDSAP
jgi:hypothetical protein